MKNDISFQYIAKDILANRKFQKISLEKHHGITRMDHTLRVAKYVYKISIKLNLDYVSATRAALLHDFFIKEEFGTNSSLVQLVVHPDVAVQNAKGEFPLNEIEENAIKSHMFPLNSELPRYKESWVLTAVDKSVATYEMFAFKYNYTKLTAKLRTQLNLIAIFMFYIITMGHK